MKTKPTNSPSHQPARPASPAVPGAISFQTEIPLSAQLSNLCVLQTFLSEMLDLQQLEPHLRQNPSALAVTHSAHDILQDHISSLKTELSVSPGVGEQMRNSAAAMVGMFRGFITKLRARELRSMLRDDFTLLAMAVRGYALLHATGLAVRDSRVVEIARSHLAQLTPLLHRFGRMIPTPLDSAPGEHDTEFEATAPDNPSMAPDALWPGPTSPA